ncbi:MAG: protein translocase subunit SecD [Phycisphaeraceae bacterium]
MTAIDILLLLYFAALIAVMLFCLARGYFTWKPALILFVLSLCTLGMWWPGHYGPDTRLRPGIDLAGGTTLVYDVRVPEGEDASRVIDELIEVLRHRVDPGGVRNLIWRQTAGNRIEIQMAAAPREVSQLRQTFQAERETLLEGNISRQQLDQALRAEGDERTARFDELAGDNAALRDRLDALGQANDALVEVTEPYQQAQQAYREAEAQQGDDEQASDRLRELRSSLQQATREYLQARRAFEQARERVMATNIDPAELQRALESSTNARSDRDLYRELAADLAPQGVTRQRFEQLLAADASEQPQRVDELAGGDEQVRELLEEAVAIRGLSQRERLIRRLQENHPERAQQIARVDEVGQAYDQVRGPLDDPNDLKALLRGAGVLEFRIAANQQRPDVEAARYRQQLQEAGPRAGASEPWRWFAVADVSRFSETRAEQDAMAEDPGSYFETRWGLVGDRYGDQYYLLLANTRDRAITRDQPGWELTGARMTSDQQGRPAVGFDLNAVGGDLMGRLTAAHVGEPMAILLDNGIISAPNLQSQIRGRGQITGSFSEAEVNYLLRTLRAGSTAAELSEEPISENTTGPQLGQDNLEAGVRAAIISLIVVGAFMLVYYLFAGLVANVALAANMLIILGIMALLQATFTLPGIAGIVLTIGMAVDANVLIFERIREELARKADIATAVRLGYEKALSTILDANITTLITCVVLGYTATAEVKGFAITLGVGIVATLFTALFVTRVILEAYLRFTHAKSMPQLPTLVGAIDRLLTPSVDWVGKRLAFFAISGVLIVGGLALVGSRGADLLDIEFRSGTKVSFDLADGEQLRISEARERLALYGTVGAAMQQAAEQGQTLDPAELETEAERQAYEQLQNIKAAAEQRRQAAVERGETVEAPVDYGLLAQATVITIGETQRTDEGTTAGGFSIATLVTDSRVVSDVVTSAFGDVLDPGLTQSIDFATQHVEEVNAAPVYPVTGRDLGETIGRPDLTAHDVQDYVGGVAIVLENLDSPVTLGEAERRINRMRMDPMFEGLGYRVFEVIGLDAAETNEQSNPRFESVVIVARDAETSYVDTPAAFGDQGGLADTEWQLVREAMQRGTSLASVSNFSSQVSATMQQQAIVAIVLALLAVVAYIWFRFGSIRYGMAAIIALVHDVCIALGILALTGFFHGDINPIARWLMIDPFKMDLAIIAAVLTIVGYSLNDTIVIFDRIRENRGRLARETPGIINDSINQTISRTVITSGTTLLAVGVLYIFGGAGVHGFAFLVLVGVAVGTYSSIAIAAPLLMLWPGKEAKPARQADGDRRSISQPASTAS